jgi:hypothetical protein
MHDQPLHTGRNLRIVVPSQPIKTVLAHLYRLLQTQEPLVTWQSHKHLSGG